MAARLRGGEACLGVVFSGAVLLDAVLNDLGAMAHLAELPGHPVHDREARTLLGLTFPPLAQLLGKTVA